MRKLKNIGGKTMTKLILQNNQKEDFLKYAYNRMNRRRPMNAKLFPHGWRKI